LKKKQMIAALIRQNPQREIGVDALVSTEKKEIGN